MLDKMLMYLNSLLSYFGLVTPRVRRYDIALDILSKARSNAAAMADASAKGDDASAKGDNVPQPASDQRETDKLLLYRQIEALRAYVARHDLLHRGPGDDEQLGVLASDLVLDKNVDKIVPRLDNVETLLEIHRAVLTEMVRQVPSKVRSAEAVRLNVDSVTSSMDGSVSPREAASGEQPSQAKQPDEYAFLWKTTEKLYDSWPIKILGLLLIAAVLLAGSGTLMIGGKAIELRKTLEDAGEREMKGFESFSKTTQDAITKQRATVLSDLDRQQTEINEKMTRADKQIRDLESRSAEIKDAAVARVAKEIRDNFPGLEKKLKDELESELTKTKENYVRDLQDKVRALVEDVSANQQLVTNSAPKIKMLVDTAADVANLKAQADSIPRARSSVEEALRKANDAQQSAQNADLKIQQLAKEVELRLKPQMDKILENEGKLGSNEKSLKTLTEKIESVGADSARIQRILDGAQHANDRLLTLKKLADDLDERIKRPPPAPPPLPKPLLTEKDLSLDQWKTIQQLLKTRGFYAGKIDGKVGAGTRDAIGKYQAARNASVNRLLASEQISDLLGQPAN